MELVEYRETKDRSGVRGYLSACVDTILRRTPVLQPLETSRPLGEYDAVLLQVPIWVEAPAIVGTALLDQVGGLLPTDTWFVVTHQAKASYEKKIPRLDRFLKTPSRGFLSVCTEAPDQAAMKAFAEQIGHG
ncbi:MAG: hypothetical protein IJ720_04370 [Clostridia bacterium]|nr:hypothetical protein [Clostridia bacterium]